MLEIKEVENEEVVNFNIQDYSRNNGSFIYNWIKRDYIIKFKGYL